MKRIVVSVAAATLLGAGAASADLALPPVKKPQNGFGIVGDDVPRPPPPPAMTADERAALAQFKKTLQDVEGMASNARVQGLAHAQGLEVLNLLWEDTGRNAGSSVGPNISDVTLQVREPLGDGSDGFRQHLLPVLRAPNFSDKTADVAADKVWIKVGNQSLSTKLVSIPLSEMLKHLREYVSDAESIGGSGDLSAERDSHYLVSAQHVFVPLPPTGKVEFNPVIFNYQSMAGSPAVLTLLVTREGTSVAAITNSGGDVIYSGRGQQLFFNNKGQKTTFTAERKSAVKARIDAGNATAADEGALDEGADMLLLVQVPLKVDRPNRGGFADGYGSGGGGIGGMDLMPAPPTAMASESAAKGAPKEARSDVEQAVLGHGTDLGAVDEGGKLKLERDPTFPVRVTVQFYKATSNGVVSADDIAAAKAQIDKVYAKADYVGSLVVPEGKRDRPTDWLLGQTQKKAPTPTPVPVPVPTATTETPPPPNGTIETIDQNKSGCGCTTTTAPEASLFASLVALLGLRRRRR